MNKSIMYIGDFIKKNGPSNVDISIRRSCGELELDNIQFIQSNQRLNFSIFRSFFSSDVIHVSGISFLGLVLVLLSKLCFKKSSLTVHGLLKKESQYQAIPKRRLLFESLFIRLVDRIFPVSPLLAQDVDSNKLIVIPNGVERKNIIYSDKDNKLITLIGGGRKQKRHLDVCKVIEKINKDKKLSIRVSIFGEKGEDSEALNQFDFVQDLGFCSKEDIENSLNRSQIFIQYSSYESFSLAVAEAINFNCKIITSDNVGINEYITRSSCYCVVSSQEQLEQTIIDMVNDEGEYNIEEHLLSWIQVTQEYYKNWSNL